MKQVRSQFLFIGAILVFASLAAPRWALAGEKTGGMQMQVRRTGPPVKIVRPARRPDIVYLRGEELMQKEEEKARIKYAARPAFGIDESEVSEAMAKTAYKPLKKPGRSPAAVAKPVLKNESKRFVPKNATKTAFTSKSAVKARGAKAALGRKASSFPALKPKLDPKRSIAASNRDGGAN